MFRRLFSIRFIPDVPLGRWARTSEKVNAIKIFWANVDHCGTCSNEKITDAQHTEKKATPTLESPRAVAGTR
jgi:hypothetical protein